MINKTRNKGQMYIFFTLQEVNSTKVIWEHIQCKHKIVKLSYNTQNKIRFKWKKWIEKIF